MKNVGVGVLVFNSEGKILLGRRAGGSEAYTWAPPGGRVDQKDYANILCDYDTSYPIEMILENEPLLEKLLTNTAFRELVEETNITDTLEIGKVALIDAIIEGEEWQTYYVLCMSDQMPELSEPNKCLEWQFFDLDQLPENLFTPFGQLVLETNGLKVITERYFRSEFDIDLGTTS